MLHFGSICAVAVRRSLPAIPVITTTSPSQRRTSPQTPFDDANHVDIRWIVDGEARIPSWRRSFYDDTGQYSNQELNQLSDDNSKGEHRQRSSGGYEELILAERQSPVPHHYTGIGSDQSPSKLDLDGNPEPDRQSENGNHILEEFQQPSRTRDRSVLRSQSDSAVDTPGQQVPQRPCSYGGVKDTSSPTDRHSYLEIIG